MEKHDGFLSRRKFLQSGALAVAAAGAVSSASGRTAKKAQPPKILNFNNAMKYRRLGGTDAHLSVLSLGAGGLQNPVAIHAIEMGVNLVSVAYDYRNGNSMGELAGVIKANRDRIYIALKDGFLKEAPDDIDPILRMLGTDHVDFIMFNRHKPEEAADPALRERFEAWKAAGKVLYCGLVTHGDIKTCVAAGLSSGMFSVIQPALTQAGFELVAEELKSAAEKGVGIITMKTMRDIKDKALETAQLKKVLANPAITSVNRGFSTFEMFDQYLKAVSETLTAEEDFSLYRYSLKHRSESCMMCGACEAACPKDIGIATMLRCKGYYNDQLGDVKTAAEAYFDLPADRRHDGNCLSCGACESVCPNGLHIVERLKEATQWAETLVPERVRLV